MRNASVKRLPRMSFILRKLKKHGAFYRRTESRAAPGEVRTLVTRRPMRERAPPIQHM